MDGLIDFHHHARPAAFFQALRGTGRDTMGGRPLPLAWTADGALAMMDRMGIACAVVSAPDADLLYRDRTVALRLSRLLNDLFADTMSSRPDRFGAFASLPMPHLDASLRETVRALDELRLDGVMLSTSYDGRYLGDPSFDDLMIELDRRRALVFVHPVSPLGLDRLVLDFPASLLEYAFDTSRAIASMLRRRVHVRYPGIRFIFSHAGGALPFLVPRMTLMASFLERDHEIDVDRDRAEIVTGLRSFHYDIALSSSDPVLSLMRAIVGLDRVVFGSDYPQVPDSYIAATAGGLTGSSSLARADIDAIRRANGLRLMPRLGLA